MNEPVGVTCDWRDRAPHTLDTSSRRTYTHPSVHPQLTNNTTRYGCNRHKQRPAVGAGGAGCGVGRGLGWGGCGVTGVWGDRGVG